MADTGSVHSWGGPRLSLTVHRRMFLGGLWLALATVFALALDPYSGSAVHETPGSAFSFFTSDVSLGPSRAPAPEKMVRASIATDPAIDAHHQAALPARAILAPPPSMQAREVAILPGTSPPARFPRGILRARAPPRA